MSSSADNPQNKDPYTAKAEQQNVTPQQKVDEARSIMKGSKFAMLTSRSSDGSLHARAMTPASDKGLVISFIGNTESGKFDELATDDNVNVSWSDPTTSDWVSAAGKAKVLKDTELIKELWNPALKSWFGDLGDGKHTGDYTDPRVGIIEVTPTEIRYWKRTTTGLGQAYEVAKGAITGTTAAPGVLRNIKGQDLVRLREMEGKKVN